MTSAQRGPFGSCCRNLRDAMTQPPVSFFKVEPELDLLVLTVGYAQAEDGRVGFFDSSISYCPFCGAQLKDPSGGATTR